MHLYNFSSPYKFETDDYSIHESDGALEIVHQCKMGFVSFLDENGNLNLSVEEKLMNIVDFN